MDFHQLILISLLLITLILFATNTIRYDLVAALTLVIAVMIGLVPSSQALSGFSHPAVMTVAAVFVISRAIEGTGVLSNLANYFMLSRKVIWKQVGILCLSVSTLSAFVNNVGAMALMIPISLKIARVKNISRRLLLMPLAFSSLLGGLLTLIGTPPNIIVSDYRAHFFKKSFSFFDFAPVGLGICFVSILFISFLGWRLIPLAHRKKEEIHHEEFTVELTVTSKSSLVGKKIAQIMQLYANKFQFIALIRDDNIICENLDYYTVKPHDAFIIETDRWTIREIVGHYKLLLNPKDEKTTESDHYLTEITLLPQSMLCGHKLDELNLYQSYGFDVVAVSKGDETVTERMQDIMFSAGDVLLIKSNQFITRDKAKQFDGLILDETHVEPFSKRKTWGVLSVFILALAFISIGNTRVDVTFFTAAVVMLLIGSINLSEAYRSINLPIIVLIGALLPVGKAIETTGTAKTIADFMFFLTQYFPPSINIFLLILFSMLLSNLINNAAIALIFSPIALQLALKWGASPDPFFMAVAVGASCAFLTPIGHQSNAMILGLGNYRFSDYWHMGLPLTLLVCFTATVLISVVWPLFPM